jgi:ribonuclease D
VDHQEITTQGQLQDYCGELCRSESIALDTEFVSEHTYRPVLCLVQVAAQGQLALIDAMALEDLSPFWEAVARPGHDTIVHAGRSELEFCLRAIGRRPAGLVDVQLAAGLVGVEYPAAYSALISKVLDVASQKHETRTDWRRRPLSLRQIDYALDDVRHLHLLYDTLRAKLSRLGRLAWLEEEMAAWQEEVERGLSEERWRRVSGSSGLDGRRLAIVRELWRWREAEAQRRDQPLRRVLRDDLIVELARRGTADVSRIRALRGLERGDLRRFLPQIAACIERALALPDEECPRVERREREPKNSVLGQFLFAALASICRGAQLAPNLVGTPGDIRELMAYRTRGERSRRRRPPRLARGWREEVVGRLFDDLLAGQTAIRIGDPNSDHPLVFERTGKGESGRGKAEGRRVRAESGKRKTEE